MLKIISIVLFAIYMPAHVCFLQVIRMDRIRPQTYLHTIDVAKSFWFSSGLIIKFTFLFIKNYSQHQ